MEGQKQQQHPPPPPPAVATSLKPDASSTSASASSPSDQQSSRPVTKVVLAIDPLNSNDDSSSPQVIENDNGAHDMRPMPGVSL